MNFYYLIAAILSGAIAIIHTFVGGVDVAEPFLMSETLSDSVKYVQYFCWHIATLTLVYLTFTFAYCAKCKNLVLGMSSTLYSAAIAVLGISMAPLVGVSYEVLPQGWLFVPLTVLGLLGFRRDNSL